VRGRIRRHGIVLVCAAAGLAIGCSAEPTTGVSEGAGAREGPLALAVAATLSQALKPTTSRTGIGPIELGEYPELTLVEIKAKGTLQRYFGNVWIFGANQGKPDRQFDGGGEFYSGSCNNNAWIAFDLPFVAAFCDQYNQRPIQEEWRTVWVVRGAGRIQWIRPPTYGPYCDVSGTPDCYRYEGNFSVSVTPFPAELVLKASKAAIESRQNVTFTANVTPDVIEGVPVPYRVQEWRWLPDAGGEGQLLDQCQGQTTCNYAPAVSGTMRATGYANGTAAEAEVHVTVFDCLTGDSLLDDPGVRDVLRQVHNGMGIGGPDSLRKERAAGMYCDATGACTSELHPVGPNDNECRMYPPAAADTSDVLIHGHPFRPRSEFTNPLYCPDGMVRPAARPSNDDFINYSGPRWLIVIDRVNVYVVPPTADGAPHQPCPSGNYDGAYTARRWSGPGACDLTADPIL
jgi:hypothetical protein